MSELAHVVLATDQKVNALIEQSSLGTTGARRLRDRVSAETADKVVARAEAAPDPTDARPRPSTLSDRLDAVLPAAAAGASGATAEVIRAITPAITRYCNARLRSTTITAEDVVQEVLLAVISNLPRYQHTRGSFLPYVYAIASHKVADAWRNDARHRAEPVDQVPDYGDEDNVPEQRVLSRERAAELGKLLDILPSRQRDILVLRVIVGLSAAETADALGISPGMVRVTQHRALTRLRDIYRADAW
ncbi:RNA polymerase sigma factor ShbA [Amycolatopsis sp. EV170708-02-1]|uniref:RNA polymerase sigma factor ShbA n=1 Tax=Amycolatopsis sp. EV170708-02-1 TaxID=2919322 RepID=UPI001F0C35B4|nr:RNA polymerase sigma factor ShbA [Amycolatopsis sp. EV170708-02-1]UMP07240.1 RNA polymerase sigma factor ShbA [Amycolatopsis sp. EV170708-02-1]